MTPARVRIVARVGAPRSSLPPFVLLSVGLHVGFVAALLFLPSLRPRKAFPIEPAIQAVLLPAPRRPAPPAPPAATAPTVEPEPEPRQEDLKAAEQDPIPDPDPPPKPKPTKVEKPKPAPSKPKPRTPSSPAPSKPGAVDDGPVGNPEGGDALAGMGSEFNWYRDAVARALYSSWRQPVLNAAEPIEVAVAFEILRGGAVRNVRLERDSGIAAVDRSVLRAVQEATLPPLPRNYREGVQPALFFRLYPE